MYRVTLSLQGTFDYTELRSSIVEDLLTVEEYTVDWQKDGSLEWSRGVSDGTYLILTAEEILPEKNLLGNFRIEEVLARDGDLILGILEPDLNSIFWRANGDIEGETHYLSVESGILLVNGDPAPWWLMDIVEAMGYYIPDKSVYTEVN